MAGGGGVVVLAEEMTEGLGIGDYHLEWAVGSSPGSRFLLD